MGLVAVTIPVEMVFVVEQWEEWPLAHIWDAEAEMVRKC